MRRLFPVLLLCVPAVPVLAADFVIEVPMKLERLLPSVAEVMVNCVVMNEDEDVIGHGQQKVVPVGGGYDGKVAVSVDVDYGRNPYAAVRYKCVMRLRNNTGREYYVPQTEEEEKHWPVWAMSKPGSELVSEVEGELPGEPAPAKDPKKK